MTDDELDEVLEDRYEAEIHAQRYREDADHSYRVSQQECKDCYYLESRGGSSGPTEWICNQCGELFTFGNNNTPIMCQDCAEELDTCMRCGEEMD